MSPAGAAAPDAFAADTASGGRGAPTVRDPRVLAAILVGGFAGAVARAALEDGWAHAPTSWPWSTFAVNLLGALALGALVVAVRARPSASRLWRPLLGTGLCGGLTTFSTLQLEVVRMLDGDAVALAVGYVGASVVAGLAAVDLGGRLARRAVGARPSRGDAATGTER